MNVEPKSPELSLVFPVFDEVANLSPLLESAVRTAGHITPDFEIVLVNDGSGDGSAGVIEYWCRKHPRVRAIHHEINGGYGSALRSGLRGARGNLVFFSDADLQFDLGEIEKLLQHSDDFDIVAGYRSPRSDPWPRIVIARIWGQIVRVLFGLRVRDIDCAFKIFRRSTLESLPLESLGAFINTEILVRAAARGARIHQIPVSHRRRRYGRQTGAKPRVLLRALVELFLLYRELRRY